MARRGHRLNASTRQRRRPGPQVATAYDVARLAGVSQSAVSRAFTEGASISSDMRAKVMHAAAALGYRPNFVARSLITRRSKIVGVLISYLYNSFYPALLGELAKQLEAIGYRALLFVSEPGQSSDPIVEEVLRYQLDGIILVAAELSSHFDDECRQVGIPVVLINRKTQSSSVSSVTAENFRGAEVVAEFLVAGKHKSFAYVAGAASSTNQDRETAYFRVLKRRGYDAPMRVEGSYTFSATAEATRVLLNRPDRPDAVFCCNDYMALAFINIARREFNIDIGRELSVVGFDNTQLGAWPLFELTSYEQPIRNMIAKAIDILSRQLNDPHAEGGQYIMPGSLIIRSSARLPDTGMTRIDGTDTWSTGRDLTHDKTTSSNGRGCG